MFMIAFLGVFFCSMTLQIFMPCYYGSVVYAKSSMLSTCGFESNWLEQSLSFKKSLIIFVERTIRPIGLKAGGLFDLNLKIFLSVMKHLKGNLLLSVWSAFYAMNYGVTALLTPEYESHVIFIII